VSARANALALSSELSGPTLLHALNGIAPEIVFTAARAVDETFRPRAAAYRIYQYHEVAPRGPLASYRAVARLVEGDVDVRSLGRGIPSDVPMRRTVQRCRVVRDTVGYRFEVRAPAFVWGMVRKIVASVRAVVEGELPRAALVDALAGRRRLTLPMAEPEPLVLWEVHYPGAWTHRVGRDPLGERRYFHETTTQARARARVLASVVAPEDGRRTRSAKGRSRRPVGSRRR